MKNHNLKLKIIFNFLPVILIFVFYFFNFSSVFAYKLLQPLPTVGGEVGAGGLSVYLSWLFRFALAAAAFLAVLQITIGGIQLIFSGASESARTSAKDRIWDAIWGLLLALGSVLILTTINPQFSEMKLGIDDINAPVQKQTTVTSVLNNWVCPADSKQYESGTDCNKYCAPACNPPKEGSPGVEKFDCNITTNDGSIAGGKVISGRSLNRTYSSKEECETACQEFKKYTPYAVSHECKVYRVY